MRIRTLAIIALASAAALSANGCRRAGQSAAEAAIAATTGGKADVRQDGDTTTIQARDGKQAMTISAGGNAKLPADFPTDVYLPSDYRVESALEMPGAIVSHVLTAGSLASVAADADQAMQAKGWKQAMVMARSEQAHIVLWEKGGRHATLTIVGDKAQGGVQVGYQLAMPKAQ